MDAGGEVHTCVKCIPQVGAVESGGGQWVPGRSLYLPLHVAVRIKLLQTLESTLKTQKLSFPGDGGQSQEHQGCGTFGRRRESKGPMRIWGCSRPWVIGPWSLGRKPEEARRPLIVKVLG